MAEPGTGAVMARGQSLGTPRRVKTQHPPRGLAGELWKKPALRALMLALVRARFTRPAAESCPAEIECYPGVPYHRHVLWKAAFYAGARLVPYGEPKRAGRRRPRLRLFWPDKTMMPGGEPRQPPPAVWFDGAFNGGARDESKERVAEAFAQAFGYPLTVDPTVHEGPCVAKSNRVNGAHDGRVVQCPIPAADPDLAYQALVDNRSAGGMVLDYRVPVVEGMIPFVYLKQRPLGVRFSNNNSDVAIARPDTVFSADEQARLGAFCRAMGIGLGGEIDVLRDAATRRLYVVDANWTSWGPPRPIATANAVRAVRFYAAALAGVLRQAA